MKSPVENEPEVGPAGGQRDALPRLFWVLWGGTLVNRLGNMVVPFLTFALTRGRGVDEADAGGIVALWGLGSMIAGSLGGIMADRIGRRPTALFGLAGGAAMVLALSLVESIAAIATFTFLLGLVSECYRPAVSAAIADIVPPRLRAKAFGLQYWAVNLGFAVAAATGGLLAKLGYGVLFAVDAATTLAYAALFFFLVPETQPAEAVEARTTGSGGLGPVLRDGVFMGFLAATLLVGLVFVQASAAQAIDMGNRGFDEAAYGLVMMLNGVLIVLFQPLAIRLLAPVDPVRVLAVTAVVNGLGFGLYAFGASLWPWAVGLAVWTSSEIAMAPVNSATVAALAPVAHRGRYQGMWSMSMGLAACVGPLVGTQVLARWGRWALWPGCALLGVVAAIGFYLLRVPLRARYAASGASDAP